MKRFAILGDYLEEGWVSMDLTAEMFIASLQANPDLNVEAKLVRPAMMRHGSQYFKHNHFLFNLDRAVARYFHYPQFLKKIRNGYDFFHVADHSYAHLLNVLPENRAGVFCHDLDVFQCLLKPKQSQQPGWFKPVARNILRGLQKAALVFYSTDTVKQAIERNGLIDEDRLVKAPYGICPEFTLTPADESKERDEQWNLETPFLLHVGSHAPRKRIDLLLEIFYELQKQYSHLNLIQVGARFSAEDQQKIKYFGIRHKIIQYHQLERKWLAVLYRKALLTLLPSDSEGFGLPIIEALACGGVVVVSDIPVFREVGGQAVIYALPGNRDSWASVIDRLLKADQPVPPLTVRLAQAQQYSWKKSAEIIMNAYQKKDFF